MDKKRKPPKKVSPKMGWDGEQVRFVEPLPEEEKKDFVLTKQSNGKQEVDRRLGTAQARIPMWINRYREVVNVAKTMAGADKKLVWVLGPTEHCSSCLKLAGKVKRGSVWMASGIQPQSSQLECGGFRCQCSLIPTDLPASRGRLPSIP